jgi:porphobilinogen synthase
MELAKKSGRLRSSNGIRKLVRETRLSVEDLVYPLYVTEGSGIRTEISSMPGVFHLSIDQLLIELDEIQDAGIPGVMLFGIPGSGNEAGFGGCDPEGVMQRALRAARSEFPELLLIADVCLCENTGYGHCSPEYEGEVYNDALLELLCKTAVSYVRAGADMVAPSDMIDGRVGAIRKALDAEGFINTAIMACSAKYASSFCGPFRKAVPSKQVQGDRKTWLMDYSNGKEVLREVELDIQEGADIVMMKPALAYLDIIGKVSGCYGVPVAAYQVSGEYFMVKAASQYGWINEKGMVLEMLTAMKRAGAGILITYYAKQLATWLEEDNA